MLVSKSVQDGIIAHNEFLAIMKEKKTMAIKKNGGYESKLSEIEIV